MGVARAGNLETAGQSNAQVVGGGLRFGGSTPKHYLSRTFSSGNRTTWTWSGWVKRTALGVTGWFLYANGSFDDTNRFSFGFDNQNVLYWSQPSYNGSSSALIRDTSAWYHVVVTYDGSNIKGYLNGNLSITSPKSGNLGINGAVAHYIGFGNGAYFQGYMAQLYFIDGQALDPSYFGFTDPLTNTWRPKKFDVTKTPGASYGTNGFYLPLDGSTPIGQDRSGRGNDWTPVNFGGSNTIEKATGALPILNTDGGGKVARVGVRTDANASSLILALPLVGIKSDFSNAINSGTSNKAITANGNAAASSAQSNFYGGSFYFDGTGDYLDTPDSADYTFGTGNFTCEMWVYPSNASDTDRFLGQINSGGNTTNMSFRMGRNSGAFICGVAEGSTDYTITGQSVPANKWTHLALVRDGNTLRAFQDGVQTGTVSFSGTVNDSSNKLAVGRLGESDGSYFTGYINDVRIYKGVAKYTSNFIPASTDPDIVPDSPSGVSYSSNVALVPNTDGGSLRFDGSGDYLRFSQSSDWAFGTGSFTIEYFIHPLYNAGNTLGFGGTRGAAGTSSGWNIGMIDSDGKSGYVQMYSDGGIAPTGQIISYGKWTHIVYTRSGSTIRAFVDGILVNTASNSQDWTLNDFSIGITGNGDAEPFNGFLSNVRIIKGSIPSSYSTSSTTAGTKIFDVPTSPLTTTSQGATSGDVKFLGCNSLISVTDFTVTPNTPTVNNQVAVSNFNPFTANINTQRGKQSGYATLNPLDSYNLTVSNGNLTVSASSAHGLVRGNVGMNTATGGKYYWEYTSTGWSNQPAIGIVGDNAKISDEISANPSRLYRASNQLYVNGTENAGWGPSWTTSDTIGIAFDATNGILNFYINGILVGSPVTGLTGTWLPGVKMYDGTSYLNFGQKPFKFPPPAGFQPLALSNTARPTIVRPDQYVGVTTYTGNGGTQSLNTGFKPDFVWIKNRDAGEHNGLFDTIRGPLYRIVSDYTYNSVLRANTLTSFDNKGFTVGSAGEYNRLNERIVAWCWKAGGNSSTFNINDVGYASASAAGLTAGTITPTAASVGTNQGFSIITWNGSGSSGTLSHGLGRTPGLIFLKGTSAGEDGQNWRTYHSALGTSPSNTLFLNLPNASSSNTERISAVGTNTFTLSSGGTGVNASGQSYIAYLWAEIPGFSKFGSYSGNSSSDGPAIITGFRPRWIMIKSSTSAYGWYIYDTVRDTYNISGKELLANEASGEASDSDIDILSNGFKLRRSSLAFNTSSQTFTYAAFAESPSFNLYGGQANAR